MFCSKCGKKNEDTAKFCYACGNNLAQDKVIAEDVVKKQNSITMQLIAKFLA